MFEPNSIRSLLSKRKSTRPQSSKQQQKGNLNNCIQTSLDPDYDIVIQAKLITKQIENKIQSIREWRKHQKQLMQQKLKSNSQLVYQINQIHFKNLQKEAQRQEQELKKILSKLQDTAQIKIKQNQQIYDSERIFKVLNQTDKYRQALKNQNLQLDTSLQTNYRSLLNQMDSINYIFKKQTVNNCLQKHKEVEKVDSKMLQKQMDQIENQLRQIQQLLADQPSDKKINNKKQSIFNKK